MSDRKVSTASWEDVRKSQPYLLFYAKHPAGPKETGTEKTVRIGNPQKQGPLHSGRAGENFISIPSPLQLSTRSGVPNGKDTALMSRCTVLLNQISSAQTTYVGEKAEELMALFVRLPDSAKLDLMMKFMDVIFRESFNIVAARQYLNEFILIVPNFDTGTQKVIIPYVLERIPASFDQNIFLLIGRLALARKEKSVNMRSTAASVSDASGSSRTDTIGRNADETFRRVSDYSLKSIASSTGTQGRLSEGMDHRRIPDAASLSGIWSEDGSFREFEKDMEIMRMKIGQKFPDSAQVPLLESILNVLRRFNAPAEADSFGEEASYGTISSAASVSVSPRNASAVRSLPHESIVASEDSSSEQSWGFSPVSKRQQRHLRHEKEKALDSPNVTRSTVFPDATRTVIEENYSSTADPCSRTAGAVTARTWTTSSAAADATTASRSSKLSMKPQGRKKIPSATANVAVTTRPNSMKSIGRDANLSNSQESLRKSHASIDYSNIRRDSSKSRQVRGSSLSKRALVSSEGNVGLSGSKEYQADDILLASRADGSTFGESVNPEQDSWRSSPTLSYPSGTIVVSDYSGMEESLRSSENPPESSAQGSTCAPDGQSSGSLGSVGCRTSSSEGNNPIVATLPSCQESPVSEAGMDLRNSGWASSLQSLDSADKTREWTEDDDTYGETADRTLIRSAANDISEPVVAAPESVQRKRRFASRLATVSVESRGRRKKDKHLASIEQKGSASNESLKVPVVEKQKTRDTVWLSFGQGPLVRSRPAEVTNPEESVGGFSTSPRLRSTAKLSSGAAVAAAPSRRAKNAPVVPVCEVSDAEEDATARLSSVTSSANPSSQSAPGFAQSDAEETSSRSLRSCGMSFNGSSTTLASSDRRQHSFVPFVSPAVVPRQDSPNPSQYLYPQSEIGRARRLSVVTGAKEKTPLQLVLEVCHPPRVTLTDSILGPDYKDLTKLGEGSFADVYSAKRKGEDVVLKIMAVDGVYWDGEPQTAMNDILSEVLISRKITDALLDKKGLYFAPVFARTYFVRVAKGAYPGEFSRRHDSFARRTPADCLNQHPSFYGENQRYVVIGLNNGGQALDAFPLMSWEQGLSVFIQVGLGLAIAEESLEFEHRDLHWSNILVRMVPSTKLIVFRKNGVVYNVPSFGVQVTIIDWTLSRMKDQVGKIIYKEPKDDVRIFEGAGDLQYDVYRDTKKENKNDWEAYFPRSNVLWLKYIQQKLLKEKHIKPVKENPSYIALKDGLPCRSKMRKLKSVQKLVETGDIFVNCRDVRAKI